MGIQVDREEFEEAEYVRFAERLEACLTALRALLQRPSFGVGEPTVGAELELFLVDRQGLPLAENAAVLQQAADPRVTLEVDRFNLELNPHPSSLAGRPFSSLGAQMAEVAAAVRRAAGAHGGRVAMVGILPTLRAADLHRGAITDSARYRALDKGLRRLRQEPIRVRIQGADPKPVELVRDDVALEGANTSFQVHLRVDPDRFGAAWNAAAGATAPVLAVAGNSPTFLGRRLWEETRVALFEQAADDRDERGRDRLVPRVAFGTRWASGDACALFEEAVRLHQPLLPLLSQEDPLRAVEDGGVPHLDELRLHQGTVWRWNRPVYDASAGGHLRLELRALPAGPTVTDMLANAAFLLGVTLAVTPRVGGWLAAFPFARAHANFYAAARFGLGAELHWPAPDGQGLRPVGAAELARRLLPEAGEALEAAGVDGGEAGRLLAVVQERLAAGQTGSVWQRRSLDALQPRLGRDRALHELLERYLELSASDQPVHTWPLAGGPQVASTPGRAWPQAAPAPPAPNSRWRTLGSPALPRSAASRVQGCCGVVVGWDRRRRLRPGLPEATLRPRRPGPGQAPRHRGSASPRGESGSTELPPARPVGSRCTGAWQPALRVPEVPAHAAAGHGCHGGHHADHGGTQRSQLTQEKHEEVVRRLTSGKSRFGSRSDVPFEGLLLHVVGRGKNGFPRCRPAAAGCCVDRRS